LYGDMIAVADDLSASPLSFDGLGNLLIGGGDLFGGTEFGYAAVVDGDEIDDALAGGAIASSTLRLDPNPGEAFYSVEYNATTDEVLVFSAGTMYRYAVPAPASFAVLMTTVLWRRSARGA
ncbi:MAG: hypothetical protein KDA28_07405, partial [Phycisphaerales bacterium]|nr:hypothetical protein [Phycisphaerales bacterium]